MADTSKNEVSDIYGYNLSEFCFMNNYIVRIVICSATVSPCQYNRLAIFAANIMYAVACSDSGDVITVGVPLSISSRILISSGN